MPLLLATAARVGALVWWLLGKDLKVHRLVKSPLWEKKKKNLKAMGELSASTNLLRELEGACVRARFRRFDCGLSS